MSTDLSDAIVFAGAATVLVFLFLHNKKNLAEVRWWNNLMFALIGFDVGGVFINLTRYFTS